MKIKLLVLTIFLFACVAAAFILSSGSTAAAVHGARQKTATPMPAPQSTPPTTGRETDDVIRVETELVTLTATVTDKNGRYRADLGGNDFTVYEDGVEQKVEYFSTGDRTPVSLGIVFDVSGSMEDKIEGVRDAVEHFVKSVTAGDEIFLIRFSTDAEIVVDFTDDRRRILRAVESLEPQGSTALYDAILLGLQKIADGRHRKRALLLLTDGNDTASAMSFQEVISLARKSEVIIYGLGIGHGREGDIHGGALAGTMKDAVDMRTLRVLADATGGNSYFLENAHEGRRDLVDEAAAEVAAELKRQYTLGYYPANKKRDGAFRQITVEVKDKALRVRTKRGYYAPQGGGKN